MNANARRVLFVTPPWSPPTQPALGPATLTAILQAHGIATDTLHCSLFFPRSAAIPGDNGQYTSLYFVPHLYEDISQELALERTMELYLLGYRTGRVSAQPDASFADLGVDEVSLRATVAAGLAGATECLERSVAVAVQSEYDVVALSCVFEFQLPGALALAARIKAVRPEMRVALGGAACLGEPGVHLLESFACLDVVCTGEGDRIIGSLVEALRAAAPEPLLAEVPGIAWRDRHGEVLHNPAAALVDRLDELPLPDYSQYLGQHRGSGWSDVPVQLLFETSRGCWWGQKHLCSFCGLNSLGLAYRRKSAARAVSEIQALWEANDQIELLVATDNILDMSYYEDVLPQLEGLASRHERPLRMFFEIKSNLKRHHVDRLVRGGVRFVQPGIEAFDDRILDLMKKGATGLQQVQAVKLLYERDIYPQYGMILRNPMEDAAAYERMTALVPYIEHLPPPKINSMVLERFSPYFDAPENHGIRNVRPYEWYGLMYRGEAVNPAKIAYMFDYDHDMFDDAALVRAHQRFAATVHEWARRWSADRAYLVQEEGAQRVVDRRLGERSELVTGLAGEVLNFLDTPHSEKAVGRRFGDVDPDLRQAALDSFVHRRWAVRDVRGWTLGVLPRKSKR